MSFALANAGLPGSPVKQEPMTQPHSRPTSELVPAFRVATRRSPLRAVVPLLLLTGVLLVFIAWLGDWRRKHNIETLLNGQVQEYVKRTNDAGLLPLNLKPDMPLDPQSRLFEGWLTADEARVLRSSDQEVMVAWTVPLLRVLGRDERGVIYFHRKQFDVRWLPLAAFGELHAKQITQIKTAVP